MEAMESNTSAVEEKDDYPDRTVSEYVQLSSNITQNEKELGEIVLDITGSRSLCASSKLCSSLITVRN